jgi:hypothetical protein
MKQGSACWLLRWRCIDYSQSRGFVFDMPDSKKDAPRDMAGNESPGPALPLHFVVNFLRPDVNGPIAVAGPLTFGILRRHYAARF